MNAKASLASTERILADRTDAHSVIYARQGKDLVDLHVGLLFVFGPIYGPGKEGSQKQHASWQRR